ncbi:MAG: DegT/DnrJ/EryC1/StrS family aminotransferase [Acidobacteria bacterium]|nr:DegT/DnrJ/EryC1/StrS family aminotransferase [Acidobacteriota bacterium]MBS1864948.1 DegT/DnrJ/EryC1/StrS family aminotransferase [Acidobacteriota bacterium]
MTSTTKVPFVDLVTMHRELESELLAVCKRVFETAGFIGGPEVEGFEKEFAAFCDAKYSVAVNSGTDALRFALMAAGIGVNDIVITVPHSFIATTEAISQAGARIEFVDIDRRSYTMDPEKLRNYMETQCALDSRTGNYVHKKLGKRVAAVVPVHLYGQMADMDPIMELAAKYNLVVVEDACQAHGAEYFSKKQNRWLKAGSVGQAAAFSFYPGKNLGACGEAGAITTNDETIAKKSAQLRDHGQAKKYYHDVEGYNGRLDSLQAGILRIKLRHLAKWNEQRHAAAKQYDSMLAPLSESVSAPQEMSYSKSVYHLYVVRTESRDELQKHLTEAGIGTGIHYPIPIHLQKAYASMGWKEGDYPETESAAKEILSLPMFGGLNENQLKLVSDAVTQFATASVAK